MTKSSEDVTTTPAPASSTKKLWGGRFRTDTDPIMVAFNNSLHFDKRMYSQDIAGSKAYAAALEKIGGDKEGGNSMTILTKEEKDEIVKGLEMVEKEWKEGVFIVKEGDEDIHTANERRLTELIGPVGGKLHTGKVSQVQILLQSIYISVCLLLTSLTPPPLIEKGYLILTKRNMLEIVYGPAFGYCTENISHSFVSIFSYLSILLCSL